MPKEKYISKINSGGNRCYFVRVPKIVNGVICNYKNDNVNRSFPVGKGTWEDALAKAVAWRDQYLEENKLTDRLIGVHRRRIGAEKHSATNKSGIIGVHIGKWTKISGDHPYWCGIASINGKNTAKQFAFSRYGEKEAFIQACLYRFRHCGTLIVLNRSILPTQPPVDYYNVKTGRLHKRCHVQVEDIYPQISNEDILYDY